MRFCTYCICESNSFNTHVKIIRRPRFIKFSLDCHLSPNFGRVGSKGSSKTVMRVFIYYHSLTFIVLQCTVPCRSARTRMILVNT